jgi:uncharacterized protein YkwD
VTKHMPVYLGLMSICVCMILSTAYADHAKSSSSVAAVLKLINRERRSKGRAALRWNAKLQSSAHRHNLRMATANALAHQLPGEADFGARERAAGVNWRSAAENIGESSGEVTSEAVDLNTLMFNETPPDNGHRLNILSTRVNVIGIDVLVDRAHDKVWLTEDFAGI